jgi:hypothetical protein
MNGGCARAGRSRLAAGCAIWLLLSLVAAGPAAAGEERRVVVNGKTLAGEELDKLDRADCRTIPDGNYWLNRRSGTWGYAGERMVQGRIGDGCRTKRSAKPKSRSIARPAAEPASAGSPPEEELRREEPITGTSPLLRAPESEVEKP